MDPGSISNGNIDHPTQMPNNSKDGPTCSTSKYLLQVLYMSIWTEGVNQSSIYPVLEWLQFIHQVIKLLYGGVWMWHFLKGPLIPMFFILETSTVCNSFLHLHYMAALMCQASCNMNFKHYFSIAKHILLNTNLAMYLMKDEKIKLDWCFMLFHWLALSFEYRLKALLIGQLVCTHKHLIIVVYLIWDGITIDSLFHLIHKFIFFN